MNSLTNSENCVKVIFIYPKTEQAEKVTLNAAQLTALLHAKQVWIEKFSTNLKIDNTVWSSTEDGVSLQIYLK